MQYVLSNFVLTKKYVQCALSIIIVTFFIIQRFIYAWNFDTSRKQYSLFDYKQPNTVSTCNNSVQLNRFCAKQCPLTCTFSNSQCLFVCRKQVLPGLSLNVLSMQYAILCKPKSCMCIIQSRTYQIPFIGGLVTWFPDTCRSKGSI